MHIQKPSSIAGRPAHKPLKRLCLPAFIAKPPLIAALALCSSSATALNSEHSKTYEEIIVTANKRPENLQQIASGISSIDGDTLDTMGAFNFEGFAHLLTGLNYSDNGSGKKKLTIRGLSDGLDYDGELQSTVAVYINDLPLTSSVSFPDLHMFDIERVELLRGPQGTLYGAGSLGGTLRIITNKAQPGENKSLLETTYSATRNGDPSYAINAMSNIPLGERLALRLVAYKKEDGGFIDNIKLDSDNTNRTKTTGARLAISYTPTDRLDISASIQYQHSDLEGHARYTPALGDLITNSPIAETQHDNSSFFNLTFHYDLDWAQLSSISAYYAGENDWYFDFSEYAYQSLHESYEQTGIEAVSGHQYDQTFNIYSQEIRLISISENNWQWTAGLYFSKDDTPLTQAVTVNNLASLLGTAAVLPGGAFYIGKDVIFYGERQHEVKQKALFGEITYAFNEQWKATLGLRWSRITLKNDNWSYGIKNLKSAPDNKGYQTSSGDISDSVVTPRAGFEYYPNKDLMIYTLVSKGYRVGGTNSAIAVAEGASESYDSDTLWNYEIGFKSDWLEKRLLLNAAAYYLDWRDIQTKQIFADSSFGYITNANQAKVLGLELESVFNASDKFKFSTGINILNAELAKDFHDEGQLQGARGDRLLGVPDFSLQAAINYLRPLSGKMHFLSKLDYHYIGESCSQFESNRETTPQDSYGNYSVFNLRAGLSMKNGWETTLFITNLTDKRARTSVTTILEEKVYTIRPRTFGLALRYSF